MGPLYLTTPACAKKRPPERPSKRFKKVTPTDAMPRFGHLETTLARLAVRRRRPPHTTWDSRPCSTPPASARAFPCMVALAGAHPGASRQFSVLSMRPTDGPNCARGAPKPRDDDPPATDPRTWPRISTLRADGTKPERPGRTLRS